MRFVIFWFRRYEKIVLERRLTTLDKEVAALSAVSALTASQEDAAVYTTGYKTTVDAGHPQHTRNRAAIAC